MEWQKGELQDAGLSQKRIDEFLQSLEQKNAAMDSVLMVSRGKLLFEKYWAPYGKNVLHRMYSAGKSITAIAIGLLLEEGKLELKDAVCGYFPDKLSDKGTHPYIAAMKIKDLLMMTTAHKTTTYKRYDGDWIESFFCLEPAYAPGGVFSYDTSATHTLSALVERLSGMEMLEYLRRKALNEIGFSKDAYWEKDAAGVTRGGDGLYCTPEDLASVAWLVLKGGEYKGKQLLPRDYLQQMTSFQISTAHLSALEEQFGYGYQTWINRYQGFTFYGMGGQLAVCFPEKEFMLVTTTGMAERPKDIRFIYESFYEILWKHIQ